MQTQEFWEHKIRKISKKGNNLTGALQKILAFPAKQTSFPTRGQMEKSPNETTWPQGVAVLVLICTSVVLICPRAYTLWANKVPKPKTNKAQKHLMRQAKQVSTSQMKKVRSVGMNTDGAGSGSGMKNMEFWDYAPDLLLLWYLI